MKQETRATEQQEESRQPPDGRPPPPSGQRFLSSFLRILPVALALLAILLLAADLRFLNRNWDEGMSLHPDERFLTMVATSIYFPEPCRAFLPHLNAEPPPVEAPQPDRDLGACLSEYLDTATSPLNPRNRGHGLFVYGYLPILLVRTVTEVLQIGDFAQVTLAGRAVSAVADLLTIVLAFFLGKRLYNSRVGLLAALLLSLSVLNIQNAHFFTVDTFTSLMTLLCVYLTVIVAEGRGRWGTFLLLGLAFGGAVASKVNVALFALIIVLAGLVRIWRRLEKEMPTGKALLMTAAELALSAALALVVFRLAQPYAFEGPGFLDVKPDVRYVENMATVQGLVSGKIDYYPSHQWTNRTPLWFPWKNMVLWGLGLPLGLAAWAGLAWATHRAWNKRDLRMIVPIGWTLFFFLYQGVQFVKSMRYNLPLYPLLCIFAAFLLLFLWEKARQSRIRRRMIAAGVLAGLVIGGTFLWATAFLQIYRRPITRLTASRWIYAHLTTDQGARLHLEDGGEVPIAIPNAQVYRAGEPGTVTPFTLPETATVTGLTIKHLEDVNHAQGKEAIHLRLTADQAGGELLAEGTIQGDWNGPAGDAAPGTVSFTPVTLQGGQTYYLHIRGERGTVKTWAVSLANEQWDDPIPMRVDGKDGFGIYRGLDLGPYGEDTPQKVRDLLHQLANTDYLCLTSNRLYDSIPRLPMRYPVTTRYYQALFDGSLGFERVATFTSYPSLFAWSVPEGIADKSDEERAAMGVWLGIPIPDQSAEEAFSVYDHPKVQIFRRTGRFDPDRAYAMLTEGIDFDRIARLRPIEVPKYRDLMLTEEEWQTQLAGGTWSELFRRDGWTNRLALPVWLLLIELIGLATWPLANFFLGKLRDGGYLPAKALGVLLLGYLSWLLAAGKLLPCTRGTIALVLGLLLLAGGLVGWFRRKELLHLLRTRRRLLLLEEGIFLGGFLLFLLIRMGNPDLWHPWFGGEKPMDLAYLNAIVRSTTFPPYDPWFAGGYLNYYYFGHVLDATLIKLTGIVPSIAYNLLIPLLYGLTWGGVFTVVYHLVHRRSDPEDDGWDRRAIWSGLAGVAFVAVLGNLGEYMLLLIKLGEISQVSLESSIPGLASLVRGVVGLWKALHNGLPVGIGSWYWDASRVMTRGEINEFPFFTFLYADLHPHMIALPYTLLLLTQLVALLREKVLPAGRLRWWAALLPSPGVLLGMVLILGALRCGHFWDFPTYLLLAVGGWAIVLYERHRRLNGALFGGPLLLALLLAVLSGLSYRPFWARYGAFYTSMQAWGGERTLIGEYLIIHGLFLFILVSYLWSETLGTGAREGLARLLGMVFRHWDRLPDLARRFSRWVHRRTLLRALLWGGGILLLVELFFFLPAQAPPPSWAEKVLPAAAFFKMRGQPLLGWLTLLALMALVLLLRRREEGPGRFVALLLLAGLGLTGGVEVLVVKGDIGRMNTVFRFYFQTWVLWGIASAAVLPRLWERVGTRWRPGARKSWRMALYILVGLCALYPLLATPAKINDRFPDTDLGPGLDGEAFMEQAVYGDEHGPIVLAEDAAAIRWLREKVQGSPVVLEGNALLYRWGNRISIHTGLPTIVGWDWHQKQQRGFVGPVVERRLQDLNILYGDPDIAKTLDLLRRYRVSYIVVGQVERYYYPAEGLAKFDQMVGTYLEQVYPAAGGAGEAIKPPPPTVSPYPVPAISSIAYPEPVPEGAAPSGAPAASAVSGPGTVIYRVLPAVWENAP